MMHARTRWIGGGLALAAAIGSLVALLGPSVAIGAAAPLTRAKVIRIVRTTAVLEGDSRYAENAPAAPVTLPTNAPSEVVLDLAGSGTQLRLSQQRRVMASAVIRVRSVGGNANGATCEISISGQDGQSSAENTPAIANYDLTLAMSESAVLEAGTHNVTVECVESDRDMEYLGGQLQVWTA